MQEFVSQENGIIGAIADGQIEVVKKADLGSAQVILGKENKDLCVIVLSSSGQSMKLPITYFDLFC